MEEMIESKKRGIRDSTQRSAGDLIGQLLQSDVEKKMTPLTDSEIKGNLFVFIVAGHETSASSLHMAITLLALHPSVQKELQKDLAQILNGRPPSEWDYEKDFPRLLNSMLGAVWNEELRLISPILTVPKMVCARPQRVIIEGRQTDLPAYMMMRLCIPSVHVVSQTTSLLNSKKVLTPLRTPNSGHVDPQPILQTPSFPSTTKPTTSKNSSLHGGSSSLLPPTPTISINTSLTKVTSPSPAHPSPKFLPLITNSSLHQKAHSSLSAKANAHASVDASLKSRS